MKKTILLLSFFLSINSYGQKENLIKFLDAYKTIEFDESKKIINELLLTNLDKYTLLDYSSPTGILFDTDSVGIKGYKALVICKLKTKADDYTDKKMFIVMYINKNTNQWSVCEFREAVDPVQEYNDTKSNVDKGIFYSEKKYVYRNMAYWALNAGKLNAAFELIKKAKVEAALSNDTKFEIADLELKLNKIR